MSVFSFYIHYKTSESDFCVKSYFIEVKTSMNNTF